jgi:hypothetical protein
LFSFLTFFALWRKASQTPFAGKVFACHGMMMLAEGELESTEPPGLEQVLPIVISVNFFVLFFFVFYDSFTEEFLEYLLGYVRSWVSEQSH